MIIIATTGATEACRGEPQIAGCARIKSVCRAHDVGVHVGGVSGPGRSFRTRIEPVRKSGKDVERESLPPGNDREQAPAFCQALRARIPGVLKGQIPAATEGNAIAYVRVARSSEEVRLEGRHGAIPLTETGNVVDIVRVGIAQSEVRPAKKASVADLLGQTRLQAVVARLGEVSELRERRKAASAAAALSLVLTGAISRRQVEDAIGGPQPEGVNVDQRREPV